MISFERGYENFQKTSSGIGGAIQSDSYVHKVEESIENLEHDINKFIGYKTNTAQLKGDVAEFWHSGTHNIDASIKNIDAKTTVNRSNEFASPDISSNFGETYGSKYYNSGTSSAMAQSTSYFQRYMEYKAKTQSEINFSEFLIERNISENDVLKHDSIYQGQVRIIPVDQLETATEFLKRKIAEEFSKRPELVNKYQDTLDMLDTKIRSGKGSESIPLTEAEASKLAGLAKEGRFDTKDWGLSTEELIKMEHILQQSLKAGMTAATISIALRIAPELYRTLEQLIKTGEIDAENFKKMGLAAAQGGAEGFIRGSISAGITTACLSGQLGVALKSVDPSVIGAVTVITLNAIQNSYKLAKNQMTKAEFADACMRDLFVTTCSLIMGGITQGAIQVPVIGFLIGSFVGSLAGSFIYNTSYKSYMSFCCETGFTFFGLVEQNYELPPDILKEIGIKTLEYKKLQLKQLNIKTLQLKQINPKRIQPKTIDITFIRRGVIEINKIGYV